MWRSRRKLDSALKNANRELQNSLKLARNYPEAVLQLAALRTQAGAPNDAIADLDHFIERESSFDARSNHSGFGADGRRTRPGSRRSLPRDSASFAGNAEAHYWIGMMLARQGNRTGSKAQFDTRRYACPDVLRAHQSARLAPDRRRPGLTQLLLE